MGGLIEMVKSTIEMHVVTPKVKAIIAPYLAHMFT